MNYSYQLFLAEYEILIVFCLWSHRPDQLVLLRSDNRKRFEPRHSIGTLAYHPTRRRHRAGGQHRLRSGRNLRGTGEHQRIR